MRIVVHLTNEEIVSTQNRTFEEIAKIENCSVEMAQFRWEELKLALENFKSLTYLALHNVEIKDKENFGGYKLFLKKININPAHIVYVCIEED